MPKKKRDSPEADSPARTLRQRAEELLKTSQTEIAGMPPGDIQSLVHELQVHQIELEIQNEELRKAQIELAESRDRYADLYEYAPVGYLTLDSSGRILQANQSAARLLDVNRGELVGAKFPDFVDRQGQDQWHFHRQAVFAGSTTQTCELPLRTGENQLLYVRLESTVESGEKDTANECRSVLTNVTKQKQAEEALRESHDRLRLAAAAAQFGSYSYDFATKTSTWSPELCALYGLPPDEQITPERIEELVFPEDRERFREYIRRAIESPSENYQADFRIVRADGEVRWMADRGKIIYAGRGGQRRPLRVVGMVIDITERKRAEEQLRDLNETLEQQVSQRTAMLKLLQDVTRMANEARTVEEAMHAAMARISRFNGWQVGHVWRLADDDSGAMVDSNIWYISDEAEKAVNRLDTLRQVSVHTRFSPGEGMIGAVAQSVRPKWIDDIAESPDWRRGDAQTLGLHAAIAFPVTVNSHVVAVLEFFSDHPARRDDRFMEIMPDVGIQLGHVVERKRLEKLAADATEGEQRRIGSDIHDGVGQELTGLRYMAQTHAEMLAAQSSPEVKTAERMTQWLETVQRQLRDIIQQLVPVEVDEKGLVAALRALCERTTATHGLVCDFQCQQTIRLPDSTLATHLYRIAQEAVRNAIQHARASRITVQLAEDDGELTLQVTDDGIGIGAATDEKAGVGIRSMTYRAGLIGATLDLHSGKKGGTIVTCKILGGVMNPTSMSVSE